MARPIINKNAIMAEFKTANAVQIQAMYALKQRQFNAVTNVYRALGGGWKSITPLSIVSQKSHSEVNLEWLLGFK